MHPLRQTNSKQRNNERMYLNHETLFDEIAVVIGVGMLYRCENGITSCSGHGATWRRKNAQASREEPGKAVHPSASRVRAAGGAVQSSAAVREAHPDAHPAPQVGVWRQNFFSWLQSAAAPGSDTHNRHLWQCKINSKTQHVFPGVKSYRFTSLQWPTRPFVSACSCQKLEFAWISDYPPQARYTWPLGN